MRTFLNVLQSVGHRTVKWRLTISCIKCQAAIHKLDLFQGELVAAVHLQNIQIFGQIGLVNSAYPNGAV